MFVSGQQCRICTKHISILRALGTRNFIYFISHMNFVIGLHPCMHIKGLRAHHPAPVCSSVERKTEGKKGMPHQCHLNYEIVSCMSEWYGVTTLQPVQFSPPSFPTACSLGWSLVSHHYTHYCSGPSESCEKIGRQLIYYTEFSKQPNSHPWWVLMGHLISAASLQLLFVTLLK